MTVLWIKIGPALLMASGDSGMVGAEMSIGTYARSCSLQTACLEQACLRDNF